MKKLLCVMMISALYAAPVLAQAPKDIPAVSAKKLARMQAPGANCGMKENANIGIVFNIHAKSFVEAKQKFDEKIKQLNDFAKQQELQKFDLQSMNYNINAQQISDEGGVMVQGYQLNGSANYQLDNADSAFKLGEFLTQQKFQVNVNVNKYRNGGGLCPAEVVD